MTSVDIYYRVLLLLLLHHVNYLYVSQYCLSLTLFQAYKVLANISRALVTNMWNWLQIDVQHNDTPWVQEADRHAMTLMQTTSHYEICNAVLDKVHGCKYQHEEQTVGEKNSLEYKNGLK